MFYVYVLYSAAYDRIYIGQTNNLSIRLEKHNSGKVKSTKPYCPWQLVHQESYASRAEAMQREKQLKSHAGRDWIRQTVLNGRVRRLPD